MAVCWASNNLLVAPLDRTNLTSTREELKVGKKIHNLMSLYFTVCRSTERAETAD